MKYSARIFVVRDNRCAFLGSLKQVCLNTPGRAVTFLWEGFRLVSQPPTGLICLPKLRDHAHRNFSTIRPKDRPHKPGNSTSTNGRLAAVLPPALLPLTH